MRIKNQDDNSNNFEGLINEISSQGTSLCSDVSTDVYLQEGGLDSNSSNDFFESNQRVCFCFFKLFTLFFIYYYSIFMVKIKFFMNKCQIDDSLGSFQMLRNKNHDLF